jgi:hypothetical protein
LTIHADRFPKGVTMAAEPMAANLDTLPVVFEAKADAPLAGALTRFSAHPVDAAQKFDSEFNQVAELIVAPPNLSVYWRYEFDRAAVAVTDEVPFKLHLVEPKVPLVQNGAMNLKVVAQRKPGHKSAIAVYPLFNPPGVSTGVATIAEGQNEALIPVSAAGNAEVRKWKTAVIAVAPVGNGPIWVSSELITLEVAPPLVAFAMERAAVEQGKTVDLFCKIQQNAPFSGSAKVRVLGLPPKVAVPEMEITKDSKELAFKLAVDKTAPAGLHRNIFCQLVVMQNGEPILHNVGGTELRIDVPLPPKAAAPAKPSAVAAKPAVETRRLSRLERLRQEQEEREKTVHR